MNTNARTVLVLATMDTKGQEGFYLGHRLACLGVQPMIMDMGTRGVPLQEKVTVPASKVARAAGATLKTLATSGNRDLNRATMVFGGLKVVQSLFQEKRIQGIMGLGGYSGASMAAEVMQCLPFGFPKILVSSAAAIPGLSSRFLETSDILLFHSVIELAGMTGLVQNVLDRAGLAMAGMLNGTVTAPDLDRNRAIAMTMMSPCEKCARTVREGLEKRGLAVVGFHASGVGDRAMESMILDGHFKGVIDLAPGGVGEHLHGFMRDPGPGRLESAGKMGLPQIISTCGVNHITPRKSRYTREHGLRRGYDLDSLRRWLRMSPRELREVAALFAEKLNRGRGPVKVLIPTRGWSSVDAPGNPTYDPGQDLLFNQELKRTLRSDIPVLGVDANMEDSSFAAAVIHHALDLLGLQETQSHETGKENMKG